MQEKGLNKKALLSELEKIHAMNQSYSEGRILCSMCTTPPPIAKKAHKLFLDANLGDPGLFHGSVKLEKEVIKQLTTLLHGDENGAGFLVSGGTEANMLALLSARNRAKVSHPEVVLPQSAHFSFNKICNILGLKAVYARLDGSFQVDSSAVAKAINKNTVTIVGTAGTAELGAVDPIDELSEIALRHGVYLHVDAAFGGLVLPFLTEPKLEFDFNLDGVKSITVDPHKMGMAPVPAGGILFRDAKAVELLKTETPYLSEDTQYTFVGTRTGASAAAAWAVFKSLGREGFARMVGNCMKTTKTLANGLVAVGFALVVEPTLNIVAFRGKNTKLLSERLWAKGWLVSYVPRLDCIRLIVMPHVKRRHAEAFLEDLRAIEKF